MLLAELLKYTPHDPSPYDNLTATASIAATSTAASEPASEAAAGEEDNNDASSSDDTKGGGGGPHYQLTLAVARVEAVALKLNARMTEVRGVAVPQ